jgi:hypothetical protein
VAAGAELRLAPPEQRSPMSRSTDHHPCDASVEVNLSPGETAME